MIELGHLQVLSAGLFCIGMYGVLARRNAVLILMGIELMVNAAIVNLVAFWRYGNPENISGQVFAIVVFAVAAALASVGLALIISIYRRRSTVVAEDINLLKW